MTPAGRARAHLLAADPRMAALVERFGELPPPGVGPSDTRRPTDLYGALVRSITGQQLSVKAARAIYDRLLARYGGRTPTPAEVLADDPEELRTACGFSRAKVAYLRSLAEHVADGSLELDRLKDLPDAEVVAELVGVKGIGEWSAHMFLLFTLARDDVWPVGDLGVRRAAERLYESDEMDLAALGEPFRPWRSWAARYLWASLANEPA